MANVVAADDLTTQGAGHQQAWYFSRNNIPALRLESHTRTIIYIQTVAYKVIMFQALTYTPFIIWK